MGLLVRVFAGGLLLSTALIVALFDGGAGEDTEESDRK